MLLWRKVRCIFLRFCNLQIVSHFSKLGTKTCSSRGCVSGGRADLLAQVWRKYTKRAFLSSLSPPGQEDRRTGCFSPSLKNPSWEPPHTHTQFHPCLQRRKGSREAPICCLPPHSMVPGAREQGSLPPTVYRRGEAGPKASHTMWPLTLVGAMETSLGN